MVNEYLIQNSEWKADKITMAGTVTPPAEDVNDSLALAVVIMPHSVSIIQCLCNAKFYTNFEITISLKIWDHLRKNFLLLFHFTQRRKPIQKMVFQKIRNELYAFGASTCPSRTTIATIYRLDRAKRTMHSRLILCKY